MGDTRPNVLLITSEDNGPELNCYGDTNVSTPHLDDLAGDGARFENAYVTQAVCSPGRSGILTGLYPHQNGQIGLASHRFRMFEGIRTLPTLLRDEGYRTGRLGKLHVRPQSAFGFDYESDPWNFESRDIATRAANAEEFMAEGEDPFFLMVNYRDAHLPWIDQDNGIPEEPLSAQDVEVPPAVGVDTPRLREHAAGYYNCLSRLDTGIGMLLRALERTGNAENTIVIYVADHGSQFSRGKMTSYELGLRTPLLVRWPGVADSGTVRSELVSQVDILPTVLDAAGVTPPSTVAGRSLRPLLAGDTDTEWRSYLFAEWNTSHPYPSPAMCYPQRTIRDDRFKLILNLLPDRENPVWRYYTVGSLVETGTKRDELETASEEVQRAYDCWRRPPEIELYDLHADPHEFNNLGQDPAYADVRNRLLSRLQRWQSETNDGFADQDKLDRFVEEHSEAADLEGDHREPGFSWDYPEYLS